MPHPSHPPWFDYLNNIWWSVKVSSSSCSPLQPPATSSLLGRNIPLSTLFSNTLNPCSSLSVGDQIQHPYKGTDKNMVLYSLIFKYLGDEKTKKSKVTDSKHSPNLICS
jgi:hypothetical protein